MSNTTSARIIALQRVVFKGDYMFRPSSLGHHQVVILIRGNHTIYNTIYELIQEEIQALTADVLARTFQNMARRVQSCLDANGGHFQHML